MSKRSLSSLFSQRKKKPRVTRSENGPLLPELPRQFQHLADYGYQVIPNVIDEATCDSLTARLKQWYVDIGTGVNFADPRTWRSENLPTTIHGIHQHYSVGHLQPVWDVRSDPRVVDVFAQLWSARPEDLLTSFDGFCLQPPPEWRLNARKIAPRADGLEGSWYHYDQRRAKIGRHCIQGFVVLEQQDADDATLMVLEKSHEYHQSFFAQFDDTPEKIRHRATKADWVKFSDDELKWLVGQPGVREVRVAAPKGSIVLWDSRTAHCSGKPRPNRAHPRWRSLIYTCYQPRALATPKLLERKQALFNERRTVNHWPVNGKPFPREPWPGKKSSEFNLPNDPIVLSELGKRLAGF